MEQRLSTAALERPRREPAASASELVESSPVGIFRTDAEGHCLYVNPRWCEIAGLAKDEALGDGWIRGLHPEDRQHVADEWYRAAKNDRPFEAEYRFRSPNGVTTWVVGRANAIRSSEGELLGYAGTIADISQLKHTERTLRERGREMDCLYAVWQVVEDRRCCFSGHSALFRSTTRHAENTKANVDSIGPDRSRRPDTGR